AHEGGYVNDPDDPGGETKFGISRKRYPDLDIRNLTREQAIQIYRRDYWLANSYDLIQDLDVAAKIFDLAVNIGPPAANKILQKSINATKAGACLEVDGIVGPKSLSSLNYHMNPAYLMAAIRLAAVNHYLSLGQPKYLAGWIRRALA
ncbi:MAG: hypothetical protein APR55_07045, partial [Methanolinea sp. SDB]